MKTQSNRKRVSVKWRFNRLLLFSAIVALAVLGVGAVSVLSRQTANGKEAKDLPTAGTTANKTRIMMRNIGQEPQTPAQDEKIQPLTPQEAETMAQGLKPLLNKSTEGLKQVQHRDGSVSLDLEGRFQNVTVARINKDGTVTTSCVDNARAAGAFFGIDHRLIENAPDSAAKKKINQN